MGSDLIPPKSEGVFAECPECHHSIRHGFQICGNCGYQLTADEQQFIGSVLNKRLLNFVISAAVIAASISVVAIELFGTN